jgi:serine/threonine protein phosphatase PrpC
MGQLTIASKTDPGRRRTENQDAVLVESVDLSAGGAAAHILAVADGVGGGPGGRLASEEAVRSLSKAVHEKFELTPSEALRHGFSLANAAVRAIAQANPDLAGMASTLTAALVRGAQVWLANVGDSRTYLVRRGSAAALTYDHSWVAEQVEAGTMTADQAAADPRRNLITRAVGVDPDLEPDLYKPVALEDGDILLLCSDGLYGVVDDAELARMAGEGAPEECVASLVALANERGGPDNISVVLAVWSTQTSPGSSEATVRI